MEAKTSADNPPRYGLIDELEGGVYILVNKATRTVLDLSNGSDWNMTKVQGWMRVHDKWFGDSRWVFRRHKPNGPWTIANLKSSTFLDLRHGRKEDGSPVFGYEHKPNTTRSLNQLWHIQPRRDGFYTLQNHTSRTVLEIPDHSTRNGTVAVCSTYVEGKDCQLWEFETASRTVEEIISILGDWDESLVSRLNQPHPLETHYFLMPDALRRTVWEGTSLRTQPVRQQMFDHDHFVVKAKDAVTSWIQSDLKMNGYGVLFGIIYGKAQKGPNAYNWYLTPDLESLVFFDPQSGTEYTTIGLGKRAFKPSFAYF